LVLGNGLFKCCRYSLDNILRVISYSSLLLASFIKNRNGNKDTANVLFLTDFFAKLTDARFINRIIGLPATLESLFEHASGKPDNSIASLLGKIMTWSMIIYHPIEHIWFLSTLKGSIFNINSDLWSQWSCRAWAVYVICDAIGTLMRSEAVSKEIKTLSTDKTMDKGEKQQKLAELKTKKQRLGIWATCIVCDFLMATHWSVEDGPLSNNQICATGIWGGVAGLYLKWKSSKQ